MEGWTDEDLVHECLVHWWLRRHRYDPARGANRRTFLNRVSENRLHDIAREVHAQRRRQPVGSRSLDVPATDDGDDLADLIAADAPEPEDEMLTSELGRHLARVRGRLTPRQRVIWDALAADPGRSRTGLARDIGISRDTLYEEIRRISGVCRDAGLREFLD
ncbi:MAG: RNA polymerase sigma factor [Dehalococcoidia bacterium]